jgi:hypothetical protein
LGPPQDKNANTLEQTADSPVPSDTVTLGTEREGALDAEVGRLYTLYRNSNSRAEQSSLRSQIESTIQSGNFGRDEKLESLAARLFEKNDTAWANKERSGGSTPGSSVEFNVRKYEVAAGQPLTGQNLFDLGKAQKLKNLASFVSLSKPAGSAKRLIDGDLSFSSRNTPAGSARSDMEGDLFNIAQSASMGADAKPGLTQPRGDSFQRHLLNRLA